MGNISVDSLSQAVGGNGLVRIHVGSLEACYARPNHRHGRENCCKLFGLLNPLVHKYGHECVEFHSHRKPPRTVIEGWIDIWEVLLKPANR